MATIVLTTPFDPGDYDSGVTNYGEVDVTDINISVKNQTIELRYEYGNTDGEWVSGRKKGVTTIPVSNWDNVADIVTQTDEKVGVAVKRAALNYLVNKGIVDGSVS